MDNSLQGVVQRSNRERIKPNWRMAYMENARKTATNELPTFAGFHRNLGLRDDGKLHLGFTLRFLGGFYCMVPSVRKRGELPLDKNKCIKLRCNSRHCRAKALIKCRDMSLIETADYKTLRSNPDLWIIFEFCNTPHTCGNAVPYYYSDKRNFGEDFRKYKSEYNDGTKCAWTMAQKDWTSGFGPGFDGIVQGLHTDHANKVQIDRARIAPSNKKAKTAFELSIPLKVLKMDMTEITADYCPVKITVPFYREQDQFGNVYFMTPKDSKLLYNSDDFFIDCTYAPVAGSVFYYQLLIICVRENIESDSARPTIRSVPVCFVYMTGAKTEHYDQVFKTIIKISTQDLKTTDGPPVVISPLFVHADAEAAIRQAVAINFPHAEFRLCLFHLLQSWRRRLLENKGIKVKLQPGPDFCPKWREFWLILAGSPNTNVLIPQVSNKIIFLLKNFVQFLKFDNLAQKAAVMDFLSYLEKNYFCVNARYPSHEWEQFSGIRGNNLNRTNNISEATNSALNRFFPKKVSFNVSIDRIYKFKLERIREGFAINPMHFFEDSVDFFVKPSKKRSITPVDYIVLNQLVTEVNRFALLSFDDQLLTLHTHLVKVGGLRSDYYKARRVLFRDQSIVNNTILDQTVNETVNETGMGSVLDTILDFTILDQTITA